MRAARRTARGAAVSAVLTLLALPLLPTGQASAASYSVTMKGYAFSPASLSVPAGSTVTWTNQDTAPHDVKTTSGPVSIHSPMLDKGQSWSFTFTTAGSYGYVCTVHPNMTAGITVRAAAPATTAAPTAHEHHTGSSSGHRAPAPSRTTPSSRPPATRMPSSSPSSAASTASPAAAGQSPQASPSAPAAQVAQQQTQTTASATRPLDPLLVLTGIVAGVAVLCLLLVGSRASAPQAPKTPREEA
ncbi:cupredoxin domain-containing protein [Streptomyces violaceus]|uniref:Cupredoxin family copper-binding protein n=1 Tax=Streptomyces violaceus TaxID=1936 RepID=A0ABY9UCD1_STRVL|nr:cupredoxin family copper-binding protein [Streptomyces janthinus]WND20485.1 cupredoxin family copper-binding protein [Streptomyces janthinus]GGS66628.1 copper-binding protein [Streptomyces janthinus]